MLSLGNFPCSTADASLYYLTTIPSATNFLQIDLAKVDINERCGFSSLASDITLALVGTILSTHDTSDLSENPRSTSPSFLVRYLVNPC